MNLKYLNKSELDTRMKSLTSRERELLHEILLTIKEIDQRKIYLDLGYSSLFSYLTAGVGYSESSAYRRVEAARLLREAPELGPKIQSGEVNLNQISVVQRAARQTQRKVSAKEKSELISKIVNLNTVETQKTVACFFDLPIEIAPKITTQKDESVRVELTIPKAIYEKVQQAQSILSHSLESQDLVHFMEYVSDRVIKQKAGVGERTNKNTSAAEVTSSNFSAKVKKETLNETKCCQYQDLQTKKICGSKWFLQVDHRQSRWAGGNGAHENAQVLCANHNRLKYRKEAGIRLTT